MLTGKRLERAVQLHFADGWDCPDQMTIELGVDLGNAEDQPVRRDLRGLQADSEQAGA